MAGLGGMFSSVLGSIGLSSVRSTIVEIAKWSAFKIFMTAIFFTGLYIVLNNFCITFATKVVTGATQAVNAAGGASFSPTVVELTGVGAYIAQKMQLVETFSMFLTGLSLAVIRKFLPF